MPMDPLHLRRHLDDLRGRIAFLRAMLPDNPSYRLWLGDVIEVAHAAVQAVGVPDEQRVELPSLHVVEHLLEAGTFHAAVSRSVVVVVARYNFPPEPVGQGARQYLAGASFSDRCAFVAGDFFEAVPPGGDVYILKSIIHDWNDERCGGILRNCHQALKPGARLIVIERVVPAKLEPRADHLSNALMDLHMLRVLGGRERTENEFRELLANGGFRMMRIAPGGAYDVIEAIVA